MLGGFRPGRGGVGLTSRVVLHDTQVPVLFSPCSV